MTEESSTREKSSFPRSVKTEGRDHSKVMSDDFKKNGYYLKTNPAVTSDESSDPSIEANASHTSTLASNDTFETLEEYPVFSKFINGFAQCVDSIQDGGLCRNAPCVAEEPPVNKPSLLYRAKCGTEKPGTKLRVRNADKESYLERFATKRLLNSRQDLACEQDATQGISKASTFDRIRGLVQRKPMKLESTDGANSRRSVPKRRHHRRRKKESRETNDASARSLISTRENLVTDKVLETTQGESSTLDATQDNVDVLLLVVSRSDDAELELFRSAAATPDMYNATTPKASFTTKLAHSPSPVASSEACIPSAPASPEKSSPGSPTETHQKSRWASPQDSQSKFSEKSRTPAAVESSTPTSPKTFAATEPPSNVSSPSSSRHSRRKIPSRFAARVGGNRFQARVSSNSVDQ